MSERVQISLLRQTLTLALLFSSCVPQEPCYSRPRVNYTAERRGEHLEMAPSRRYIVDDPAHELDPRVLDATVDNVVSCISSVLPLASSEREAAACVGEPTLEVRSCLTVRVPSWHVSPCTGRQLFACAVPAESCLAKGETPTAECPCACRAIIQDNEMILTAPNLELFPARLTELMTGCDYIWGTRLAKCGSPGLVAR